MNQKIEILGVNISLLNENNILVKLQDLFLHPKKVGDGHVIVTPNPEFLLLARTDLQFRDDLNRADIAIADGVGLQYAAFFLGKSIPPRITGIDLLKKILFLAEKTKQKVFIIVAEGGLSTKKNIDATLHKEYPQLCFDSTLWPSKHIMISKQTRGKEKNNALVEKILFIEKSEPDIIFVGLGQKIQERWIFQHKKFFPKVKLWMGVGGSFDFLTQNVKRAPFCLRLLGLEWLWRLFLQPKR